MTEDPLRHTGRTTRVVLSALVSALSGQRTFMVFKTRKELVTWLDWICEVPGVSGARDIPAEISQIMMESDTLRFKGGGSLTLLSLGGVGVKYDGSYVSLHGRGSYTRFADQRTDQIYWDHTLNLTADLGEEICP